MVSGPAHSVESQSILRGPVIRRPCSGPHPQAASKAHRGARFSGSVGARDQIQPSQRKDDVAQRAIAGDRQRFDHARRITCRPDASGGNIKSAATGTKRGVAVRRNYTSLEQERAMKAMFTTTYGSPEFSHCEEVAKRSRATIKSSSESAPRPSMRSTWIDERQAVLRSLLLRFPQSKDHAARTRCRR